MTDTPINHMAELIKYAEAGHPTAHWAREHIANLARQLREQLLEEDVAALKDQRSQLERRLTEMADLTDTLNGRIAEASDILAGLQDD